MTVPITNPPARVMGEDQHAILTAQLNTWQEQGHLQDAIDHWKTLQSSPSPPDWVTSHLGTLATLLNKQGVKNLNADQMEKGLAYFRLALHACPDFAPALSNAATCLRGLGCLKESTLLYRQALALNPDLAAAHDGLLMNFHYSMDRDLVTMAAAHRAWGQRFCAAFSYPSPPAPVANKKILHIGFVSADLGQHPVGYFLVRYLEHIDRQTFTIHSYADGKRQGYLTDRLACRNTVQSRLF